MVLCPGFFSGNFFPSFEMACVGVVEMVVTLRASIFTNICSNSQSLVLTNMIVQTSMHGSDMARAIKHGALLVLPYAQRYSSKMASST